MITSLKTKALVSVFKKLFKFHFLILYVNNNITNSATLCAELWFPNQSMPATKSSAYKSEGVETQQFNNSEKIKSRTT